jgi:hypothetical protein
MQNGNIKKKEMIMEGCDYNFSPSEIPGLPRDFCFNILPVSLN